MKFIRPCLFLFFGSFDFAQDYNLLKIFEPYPIILTFRGFGGTIGLGLISLSFDTKIHHFPRKEKYEGERTETLRQEAPVSDLDYSFLCFCYVHSLFAKHLVYLYKYDGD
jgi:hypothetical protein